LRCPDDVRRVELATIDPSKEITKMSTLDDALQRVRAMRRTFEGSLAPIPAFYLLRVVTDPVARAQLEEILWPDQNFRYWRALGDIEQQLEGSVVK
jgi:hypothetical protein